MDDQTIKTNAGLSNEAYHAYTENDIGTNITVNGQSWTVYAVSDPAENGFYGVAFQKHRERR